MSKIPRILRILGRKVVLTPRLKKDMPHVLGEWHADRNAIVIRKEQLPLEEADTVLHEVMHATLHLQGRAYAGKTEELYVRALATGMLAVLRENPKFVSYLMQGIKP